MSPWGLICCGLSYGLVTVTPSCDAAKANRSSSSAVTSGSLMPCSALATIWAVNPARLGSLASSSSWTSLDSLEGNVKSVR